jgi:hypothetical protein
MQFNRRLVFCEALALALILGLSGAFNHLRADTGACGGANVTLPFTDLAGNGFFCQIAAAYFAGLTNGTSATTFSPANNVTRDQMTAFITRTLDQSLRRGSRRAALGQWATPTAIRADLAVNVGNSPSVVLSSGKDVWVSVAGENKIKRVQASDGRVLEEWSGAYGVTDLVFFAGRIYGVGLDNQGKNFFTLALSAQPGSAVYLADVGPAPTGITTDGTSLWVSTAVGITKVNPANTVDQARYNLGYCEDTVYDGTHLWVSVVGQKALKKLNPADGSVLQTVTLEADSGKMVFDGSNLWVIGFDNKLRVVRAATGALLATLTDNGLFAPQSIAFDGQRILVTTGTQFIGGGASLWKASDLTPLGSVQVSAMGSGPRGVCSDGLNFWIALNSAGKLARF